MLGGGGKEGKERIFQRGIKGERRRSRFSLATRLWTLISSCLRKTPPFIQTSPSLCCRGGGRNKLAGPIQQKFQIDYEDTRWRVSLETPGDQQQYVHNSTQQYSVLLITYSVALCNFDLVLIPQLCLSCLHLSWV